MPSMLDGLRLAFPPKIIMHYHMFYSIIIIFSLAPNIRSFAPTNPKGAQALSKEFPTSAPRLIHGANPQSNSPKKQFALSGFRT